MSQSTVTLEGQHRPLVLPLCITVRNEASRLRVTEHVHAGTPFTSRF